MENSSQLFLVPEQKTVREKLHHETTFESDVEFFFGDAVVRSPVFVFLEGDFGREKLEAESEMRVLRRRSWTSLSSRSDLNLNPVSLIVTLL